MCDVRCSETMANTEEREIDLGMPKSKRKRTGLSCCVANCIGVHSDGLSLYSFPKEPNIRRQWIKFVQVCRADTKCKQKILRETLRGRLLHTNMSAERQTLSDKPPSNLQMIGTWDSSYDQDGYSGSCATVYRAMSAWLLRAVPGLVYASVILSFFLNLAIGYFHWTSQTLSTLLNFWRNSVIL